MGEGSTKTYGIGGVRVSQAIREAAAGLVPTSDTARLDAEVLMAHAQGVTRSDLLLRRMDDPAPAEFTTLVERRAAHEPVAYIIGTQEFFGLPFRVTADVLIPRGDSEVLVERALTAKPNAHRVLDCGTGSGALLLAVLANLSQAEGIGIDRSAAALAVASGNAESLGLRTRARMIAADWSQAGWAEGLGRFDLILANPPYVETDADLAPSVRSYEPAGALFSGPEGLDDYRLLIPQLPDLLTPGGTALIEIGASQTHAVCTIAGESGFATQVHHDLGGRARVIELTLRA
ncbi:peptide chain release factor N(5)-glutamine methyltransferase [Novosphingobium sp. 9U]|uniref:peptide chain release factor N(5)-glutamine methyltransferase n=1 Tax=Novosphingobium sp. 9U TaxID=2653158 RepID=UPI0012F2E811|nr:peptide chain release factor N(5)-glutamine methyltransferase [Novosphingobium sp. 9U]VWX53443.1 Release factor glutamine methyltransferase [Novosphingobium sp. 9U]